MVTNLLPDVLVIGAGVSGLTTAVCLAEAGVAVRVRAMRPPLETTSFAAGAMWDPDDVIDDERAARWSEITRLMLEKLASEDSGVRLTRGLEAAHTTVDPPAWVVDLEAYAVSHPGELPAGYVSGWWYRIPMVDMPTYLDYLTHRLTAAGGEIEIGAITSLDEAHDQAPIAVNCAGFGARNLVPDEGVVPIKGQLVVVENPGIEHFFVEYEEGEELTYILPQGDHVVLGGTALPDRADMAPDAPATEGILRRCATVEPLLRRTKIKGVRVGIRPSRPRVRLERVDTGVRSLIHNYGHGRSGVTLSWGCALDVLALVLDSA